MRVCELRDASDYRTLSGASETLSRVSVSDCRVDWQLDFAACRERKKEVGRTLVKIRSFRETTATRHQPQLARRDIVNAR